MMAAHTRQVLLGQAASNGFPARRLTKAGNEGGEWVTAYQAEQRSRLRAVFHSQTYEKGWGKSGQLYPPTNTRDVSGAPRRVLDRVFLMRHCYVEQPCDLSYCDICGVHLKNYKPEDFTEFDCLVHMNASDTELPMEAFSTFPVLEQLELSVCGISDISINTHDFSKLQILDLSYNTVSGKTVLVLGKLPALTELHLTGNNLVALPVEMSRPFEILSEEGSSLRMRFAALEKLWLDDNKLTDQTTFSTLAGLRRLKYLNLDNNELYVVPQLRLIGTSPLKSAVNSKRQATPHTRATPRHRMTTPKRTRVSSERGVASQGFRMSDTLSTASPKQEDIEIVDSSPAIYHGPETNTEADSKTQTNTEADSKTQTSSLMAAGVAQEQVKVVGNGEGEMEGEERVNEGDGGVRKEKLSEEVGEKGREPCALRDVDTPVSVSRLTPSMAPFPGLHTVSLVNNLFLSSDGLLACGSWPSLKEIIIYGNPLVRMCKGMPPRLQIELVQKHNINIVRKKPSSRIPFRIGKAAKGFKKVSSALPPTIPKQTLLALPPIEGPLMIELPSSPFPSSPSSSPSSRSPTTYSPPGSIHKHTGSDTELLQSREEGGEDSKEGVFITQGTGEQEDTPSHPRHIGQAAAAYETAVAGWRVGREGERSVQREMRQWRRALREKHADIPEHYRGYEALLEDDVAATAHIPTDLHGCIHALHHALKHPTPLSQKAPTHRRDQQRKSLAVVPSQETAMHHKVQGLQMALRDVHSSTALLEANLAEALQMETRTSRNDKPLQKEGRLLLKQLQATYDEVRTASLSNAESTSEHDCEH